MDEVVIPWINGSTSPDDQPPQPSFQENHEHTSEGGSSHGLEVGRLHLVGQPHLPTAIPTKTDARNRPSTTSGSRIKSVQVKRWWIIGPATHLDLAEPMKMGPRLQPTSLNYKRSLTPAGSNTPRWSISFPLFCSLRVGLV
jgi:hypothetical protein